MIGQRIRGLMMTMQDAIDRAAALNTQHRSAIAYASGLLRYSALLQIKHDDAADALDGLANHPAYEYRVYHAPEAWLPISPDEYYVLTPQGLGDDKSMVCVWQPSDAQI